MSHKRKQDRQRIVAKLDDLIRRYKYDARSWWPNFVFHYTTLENAISILKRGSLYSREKVVSRGLLRSDSASSSVLARTSDAYKKYARLYFRPKTPTQYSNEGIRPRDALVHAAHCPIPVFLLFNSRDVLTRASTRFSRDHWQDIVQDLSERRHLFSRNCPSTRSITTRGWERTRSERS